MNDDIPSVEEIKEDIREDVEYLHTGRWIIAEIETDEYKTVVQEKEMFGEDEALEKLAKKLRDRKQQDIESKKTQERLRKRLDEKKPLDK